MKPVSPRRPLVSLVLFGLLAGGGAGRAVAAAPGAKAIVERAVHNQVFYLAGAEMKMAMLLRNKRGETRERRMLTRTMRQKGLSRTLTRFLAPRDVANTAFLFVEQAGTDDVQYMYLPALNVVRRIAGAQKDSSFMGSDFTYADLESRDLSEAHYKQLSDETLGRSDCYVIESRPTKKGSYSRLVSWIRKTDHVLLRVKFFDQGGGLVKTMFAKQVQQVGPAKVLSRIKVVNHSTGHSTLLQISDIVLRKDLKASDFTKRALRK